MRVLRLFIYSTFCYLVNAIIATIGGRKMSQLYVRLPDDVHSKLRVIAALKNESLNSTMITASAHYVEDWEKKHGELPTPPEEE
jgi:predicted HicB family RNase H-like nuclease